MKQTVFYYCFYENHCKTIEKNMCFCINVCKSNGFILFFVFFIKVNKNKKNTNLEDTEIVSGCSCLL